MNHIDVDVLECIFSDAHVVDCDFSEWDRRVAMVVLADHMEFRESRLPCYEIKFIRPTNFEVKFEHHNIALAGSDSHFQWRIDGMSLDIGERECRIKLIGRATGSPAAFIVCEGIEVEEISLAALDRLFPGWDKPSSPLARPGIREMARRMKKRR